jgi:hypothetical protein
LIPLFPLLAAAIQSLLPRRQRKLSAGLCIVAMGASCILAGRAFLATIGGGHHEVSRAFHSFTWFSFGTTKLEMSLILDPLTAGMAAMVAFVGFWIFVNATGYMAEDDNFTRFFCFLSLFAASMLGLVVSNNLLLLFMCWELVGLCSYLLIGFWYFKPAAAAAMKKAFITTRIGDVGFFLGILMLYWKTGTLTLYTADGTGALQQADKLAAMTGWSISGWFTLSAAGTIAVLLFIGAMGKSAQFPLHVWLPDAMEGPTPVSALIHAATMVAAGVFMVGRMFPLFTAGAPEGGTTPAGIRDVGRLHHGGVLGDDCRGAIRHQTRAGVFDVLATWLHGDGARRRQPGGGTVSSADACVLQGPTVPRFRLRHHRHAPRAGHAEDGRPEEVHADHLLVLSHWHAGSLRCAPVRRFLLEGRNTARNLPPQQNGLGIGDVRGVPDGLLHDAADVHGVRRQVARR